MTPASMDTFSCPRCGESLPAGFSRCDACGAYLVAAPAAAGPSSSRPEGTRGGALPGARKTAPGGSPGPSWLFLVIGLACGGAVGYALHGAVGPRDQGGMPKGPSDVMRGAAMGGGQMPPQMPPQVVAMVQKYRQALARDPDDLEANIGFGNLLFDSGQWQKAIDHYQRALKKSPGDADVRVDMAVAIHSLGQDDIARKELERVTREKPTHLNAWLNLGVVAATLGDNAGAIRAWERYLELDPQGEHAGAVRAQIEMLKKGS
ncbi:MAG: tetratricopeptide repeat protein [Candidatus Eisenbacteria bacterium]|uniref:Tetratricopeptide repeat protein n=1 Tax=Eiseniibacteriota bacterium TaxID=2212470 RepID=A0A538TUR1_UNCEI|nr:MAG: tetratricopeptide repeat protein [Candidatus Eisenbacteria bacterium]